jgi:hypothetical protein
VPLIADALNDRLPRNYVARLDEYVSLVAPVTEVPQESLHVPVVTLTRCAQAAGPASRGGGAAVVALEPVTLDNVLVSDARTEVLIRVIRLPEQELVTVIELLSPTNKYGGGRGEYLQKRREFLGLPVNVVEFDLLRAGARLPFATPFPAGTTSGSSPAPPTSVRRKRTAGRSRPLAGNPRAASRGRSGRSDPPGRAVRRGVRAGTVRRADRLLGGGGAAAGVRIGRGRVGRRDCPRRSTAVMSDATYSKRCWFTFPTRLQVEQPVIWQMSRTFPNVMFDIRQASVQNEIGIMAVLLSGPEAT